MWRFLEHRQPGYLIWNTTCPNTGRLDQTQRSLIEDGMHETSDNNDGPQRTKRQDYDNSIIRALRQEHRLLRFPAPKLIDVGTGTGQFLVRLAEDSRFNDFDLVGIDSSSEMLDVATDVTSEAGFADRIRLEVQDVHSLPYSDGHCEYITSQSTVHQWENPVKAFQEIFRVLKPNGVAIIHEPRRDIEMNTLVAVRAKLARFGLEMDSLSEKHTPGEVWDFLEEAGLAAQSIINSPSSSIGFEIRISKSTDTQAQHPRSVIRPSAKE